jgi:hypothetical protein
MKNSFNRFNCFLIVRNNSHLWPKDKPRLRHAPGEGHLDTVLNFEVGPRIHFRPDRPKHCPNLAAVTAKQASASSLQPPKKTV